MPIRRWSVMLPFVATCALAQTSTPSAPPAPPAQAVPKPGGSAVTDSKLSEEVTVRLGEVQILVTDRDGNPIVDLKPEEVEVRERGAKRRLASLERFATRDLAAQVPQATPIQGQAPPPEPVLVPPPPPRRRYVLLFDVWNSRLPDRRRWVTAAHAWVEKEMRTDDDVSIALLESSGVRTIVPFTNERSLLEHTLAEPGFVESASHHDFLSDMKRLMDDLDTCSSAHDPANCSRTASQPYVFEWRTRSETTISALRRLAASLGAIPGRKIVLYMSEGFIPNPGNIVSTAILAKLGTDKVRYQDLQSTLRRDVYPQMMDLERTASAVDAAFFTFDTRPASVREALTDVDQRTDVFHERNAGDPFAGTFDASRSALSVLSMETGGRSFHGPGIEKNLSVAARAVEGLYTVAFYRDAAASTEPKIKLKVARRGAEVSFPDRYDPTRDSRVGMPLEIALGRSHPSETAFLLPVLLQLPAADLTFRREEGAANYLADVAIFVEAISPTGERLAEAYETVQVKLDAQQYDARISQKFAHAIGILVQPGPMRIRARAADADARRLAERAIDVTLGPSGVTTAGFSAPGVQKTEQNQASGH